jgi:hypothetical protein
MPSVNFRQLRDTRQLLSNRVVARIVPETPRTQPVEWPDFEARAREIFGDRVLNAVDDLIAERNSRF